ncbi:hypothetical protein GBAR_LOCUS3837, partial [Geodia barretti]
RGSHAHARTSSCSTKVRRWDNMCFASTILHLLFNQQNLRNFIDCACSTIHLNAKFASKECSPNHLSLHLSFPTTYPIYRGVVW